MWVYEYLDGMGYRVGYVVGAEVTWTERYTYLHHAREAVNYLNGGNE